MNESGASVQEIVNFYKIPINNIWVVHDDLDLPMDTVKISFNSSAAGHKGVQSIINYVGSQNFWRFRIGLGRPPLPQPVENFVLEPLTSDAQIIMQKNIDNAVQQIQQALNQGLPKISHQ